MKKILSQKISFVLVVVFLLALSSAFLFYLWQEPKQTQGETVWQKENVGGYEIDGNIIRNLDYGLELNAPEGWIVKNYNEGGVGVFSPEVDANNFVKSARENGGCILGVLINNYKKVNSKIDTDAEILLKMINEIKNNKNILNEDGIKYELISLNGRDFLKRTYFVNNKEASIEVEIPIGESIYSFVDRPIFSNARRYVFWL